MDGSVGVSFNRVSEVVCHLNATTDPRRDSIHQRPVRRARPRDERNRQRQQN